MYVRLYTTNNNNAILQMDKYLFLSKYLSNAYVLCFEKGMLNFRFLL